MIILLLKTGKGYKKLSSVMKIFSILLGGVIIQVYKIFKTHGTEHFRSVHFIVC